MSKWKINVTCLHDTNQYDYSKSGNTCQRKDVSQCKNGQDKSENLKYGKVYKKCIDFRWKTTNVSCNKDTNQYDYYEKNEYRKNVSECSSGQTKSNNIQYGEIKYKCSDYKWKFDKVSCNSDDRYNTYKASGQKCIREIKRACPTRDNNSRVKRNPRRCITKCKGIRTETELKCNFGYKKSGNTKCIR